MMGKTYDTTPAVVYHGTLRIYDQEDEEHLYRGRGKPC